MLRRVNVGLTLLSLTLHARDFYVTFTLAFTLLLRDFYVGRTSSHFGKTTIMDYIRAVGTQSRILQGLYTTLYTCTYGTNSGAYRQPGQSQEPASLR